MLQNKSNKNNHGICGSSSTSNKQRNNNNNHLTVEKTENVLGLFRINLKFSNAAIATILSVRRCHMIGLHSGTNLIGNLFLRGYTSENAHGFEMEELLGIYDELEFYTKFKQSIKIRILRSEYMHLYLFFLSVSVSSSLLLARAHINSYMC